ncbi:hypothetical protein J8N05_33615 [Streptomyces sp. BH-SS-21]|uniref:Uncharacterized protein n=1 Tax=Streptomyces liliiviolaceus TaxID=2823109 RepID=A0A940Y5X6_9ACTN|nr:hypothetical protein [Streptomyces liliiviolaceus]MBQ0853110.1 hypothetical protein [Streptomyces liliiviolaceus]
MLALRLVRGAHPAVQFRRLLVAAASAGTGFLLLCALGYALGHPEASTAAVLRLAWCLVPIAATVHFAVAVARTDPATRPRAGLAAIGLGPGQLMVLAAVSTAVSCTLGSMVALLFFLHLRGDLTGLPFDGDAAGFLAANQPLPLPATLTLLALVPVLASAAGAIVLRPRAQAPTAGGRPVRLGGFGGYGRSTDRIGTSTYGRFGTHANGDTQPPPAPKGARGTARQAPTGPQAPHNPHTPLPPLPTPTGLPWGAALLAAGLAVETYAGRGTHEGPALPGGLTAGPFAVLAGWALTALGLALAGPALTHLCGRLLQSVRPSALRLLAGRVLMEEATRIGRPLGVVCAVASGTYALALLHTGARPGIGPLTTLGLLLVAGCALATLLTAAVEARDARAGTTAALLRIGAPASTLRAAAALRAGTLIAVLTPLTWAIAQLAAMPLVR